MEKELVVGNRKIRYTLKKNKFSKHLRLSIYPDGRVLLTMPPRFPLYQARLFLAQKSDWILEKLARMAPPSISEEDRAKEYKKLKRKALIFVKGKLEDLNGVYGFSYKKISIRNQRTRWGSCSSSGTLSFNYRIVLLPEELGEYVVAHELCHIKEMNHSAKFWSLVARTIPDYRKRRMELKKLHLL